MDPNQQAMMMQHEYYAQQQAMMGQVGGLVRNAGLSKGMARAANGVTYLDSTSVTPCPCTKL